LMPQQVMWREVTGRPVRDIVVAPWGREWAAAAIITAAILGIAVAWNPSELAHWFIAPVLVAGLMLGPQALSWVSGRRDLLDPVGVVGAYGYYVFFIAPLITVGSGYHTRGLPVPPDWRDWVGWLAIICAAGIVVYQMCLLAMLKRRRSPSQWAVNPSNLRAAAVVALPLTLGVQVYLYAKFGGVGGFVEAYTESAREHFSGLGPAFVVAEAFPVLLGATILLGWRDRLTKSGHGKWLLLLVAFFAVRVLFGGLRGSRSTTVLTVMWFVGCSHIWIRPLGWRTKALGAASLLIFMYGYGLYKSSGVQFLESVQTLDAVRSTEEKSGRTLMTTLVADLAKSEIQAVVLYRTQQPDYELALGSTYVEAILLPFPRALVDIRPDGKVRKGTEALYGRDAYVAGQWEASQVYGLVGEALLNWPAFMAPLAFALMAALVASARRNWMDLERSDPRLLMHPIWLTCCLVVLVSDSGNAVAYLMRAAVIPMVFLWAVSKKVSATGGHGHSHRIGRSG